MPPPGRPKCTELRQGVRCWPGQRAPHTVKGQTQSQAGMRNSQSSTGRRAGSGLEDTGSRQRAQHGRRSGWEPQGAHRRSWGLPPLPLLTGRIPPQPSSKAQVGLQQPLLAQPGPLQALAASHYPEEPLDCEGLECLTNARPLIGKLLTSPGRMLIWLLFHPLCPRLETNKTLYQAPPTPRPQCPFPMGRDGTGTERRPTTCTCPGRWRSTAAPRD